jgi:toluene methyl-monooxygenase electron transfer component
VFGMFSRKGPFTASISPANKRVEVQAGDNLLKAALAAGLAWPHNCRVGSCGECRARLISGRIKPLNDFSYVLDEAELDAGMILACQTSLRSDIEVEITLGEGGGLPVPKSVSGVIERTRPLTHDITEVHVHLDEPLPAYRAGQYADIWVPGVIDKPRSYSFATAPVSGDAVEKVSFFVRHIPGGEMSGWLHAESRDGTRISLAGPYGNFWLRDSNAPILCVAGGSGLAPIKALLEQISAGGFQRKAILVFGARTQDDLYCLDELQRIKAQGNGQFIFAPILSQEPEASAWDGPRGNCTDMLAEMAEDLADYEAYLCGPPIMIDLAIECLTNSGVKTERIYYDKFLDASNLPGGRAAAVGS